MANRGTIEKEGIQMRKITIGTCLVLVFLSLAFSAMAAEITLNAKDGADLAARLANQPYKAGDTLILKGSFASPKTVFPQEIHVVLADGATVYGNLFFPGGGSIAGQGTYGHVFGNFSGARTFVVGDMDLNGSITIGSPLEDVISPNGRIRIEGNVQVASVGETGVFSTGDIEIGFNSSLTVFSYGELSSTTFLARQDILVEESAFLYVSVGPRASNAIVADRDIRIGENAWIGGVGGSEASGICAGRRLVVGEDAGVYGQGFDMYGYGIMTRALEVGTNAYVKAESTYDSICIDPLGPNCLFIDPTATLQSESILFVNDYDFTSDMTFFYAGEKPILRLENDYGAVVSHPERFHPIPEEDLDNA